MIEHFAEDYRKAFKEVLDEISIPDLEAVANLLQEAYQKQKKIFIIGNGGSAATASHFANDLNQTAAVEGKHRFRATCLSDNIPAVTAISNDISYDEVFSEQLKNFLDEGDLLIALTGSGDSKNVLRAVEFAKKQGAITIGLIGFGGGKLKGLVDQAIILSSKQYGLVETAHLFLEHLFAFYFKKQIGKS